MKGLKAGITALMLSVFASGSVQAHEFWMVPHDAVTQSGQQVLFELRIGSQLPGSQTSRLPGLVEEFTATDARGTYPVKGHDNSRVIGHLRPRAAGATLVALRTNQAQITLSAAEFEQYLREEGLEKIIHQREQRGHSARPGSELYSRCAKSIVLVDGQSQGFDKTAGLPLELVPLTEPLHYQPGQSWRMRLLREGQPLAGTQVKAQLQGKQIYVLKAVTDAKGEVTLTLPEAGQWLFSAEDMVPSQDPDAEWESLWASVTVPVGGRNS